MAEAAPDPEGAVDAADLIAFMRGYSTLPSSQWRRLFPEWSALVDKACARFDQEAGHGSRPQSASSSMVSSKDEAIWRWVFLPLMAQVPA